jgi:carboxyl-terminal processing protease
VAEPILFTLKRDNILNSAITAAYRIGDVGYIAISNFSRPLGAEFYKAINSVGDIRSIVIDLRDNGGGALTSAIDLSSLFLNKGDVIVTTEGRNKKVTHYKRRDDKPFDLPLVVLVNENSASASELFTGAMQDHDRGIIVGRTTYGKGLVQRMIKLQDGSGVSITIARYKTPSGRIIQRPYEMGKGGEYMADSTRYLHPDSISFSNRPAFTTLKKGRKVYGGGGITPDIYIPAENLPLSECVVKAYNEALFEHTIIELCDVIDTEALLQQHPTHEDFATSYNLDNRAKELFYTLAGFTEKDITQEDKEYIEVMLTATLAEQLYGKNGKHFIYNLRYDNLLHRAIEIASEK